MLGLDRCRGKGDNKQNKQRTPGWRTQMLVSLARREMSSSVGLTEKSASHGEPKNLMFYNQVPDLNYIYSIYIYIHIFLSFSYFQTKRFVHNFGWNPAVVTQRDATVVPEPPAQSSGDNKPQVSCGYEHFNKSIDTAAHKAT